MPESTNRGRITWARSLLVSGVFLLIGLTAAGCVTTQDAADPGVFKTGSTYYIAATSGGNQSTGVMPVKATNDLQHWSAVGQIFAPGHVPSWSDPSRGGYWAPEIYYFHAINSYVAYYSALCNGSDLCPNHTTQRCIGRATSNAPYSFNDLGRPLICQSDGSYSVIGATIFDDNGQHYIVYKDDIPSPGTKRITIRTIGADGLSNLGASHHILTPTQAWEVNGWSSVEAPVMTRRGSYYYLLYSGNLYKRDQYGEGVARCPVSLGSPAACDLSSSAGFNQNKYPSNPILSGAGSRFCGVGTADLSDNANYIWYSAYESQNSDGGCTGRRLLGVDSIDWSSGWPRVGDGRPSG